MEEKKNKEKKKEKYRVVIGGELKGVLDKQINNIKNACYGYTNPTYKEAGEILAHKLKKAGLV